MDNDRPMSIYLTDKGDKPFLEEIAHYLEDRGLTTQDIGGVIPFKRHNHHVHDANGREYILKGWAFQVRELDGSFADNQLIFRPCNYPPGKLYQIQGGKDVEFSKPKFIQIGKGNVLHHCGSFDDFCTASVVGLHEKIVSAELCRKVLGIPCLGISGCSGWGKDGRIMPKLAEIIDRMAHSATLVVMFDGDILTNNHIMQAASKFQGAVQLLRPDIIVAFPKVPSNANGVGWDDWAVGQGDMLQERWLQILNSDGIEVEDVIPLGWLVENYGVSRKLTQRSEQLEQTQDNYRRLLRFPRWDSYTVDINGDIYDSDGYYGSEESLFNSFLVWLERTVCQGYGDKVNTSRARAAFSAWLMDKRCSVPIKLLLDQAPITTAEAKVVALRLITEGFQVTGPMTQAETVDTVLRMFRDTVLRWGCDRDVDIQWCWCTIGPTGCGKSSFSKFLFDGLMDLGYHRQPKGYLNKKDPKLEEENRKARDSLVIGIDDYNPGELYARIVENMFYTMSSTRTVIQREPYGHKPEEVMLHAIYFLSTTDKTKQFIRSAKGTGERRFIVTEGLGTEMVSGMLRVNKKVLKETGLQLLVWAAHRGGEIAGDATEFSSKYTEQYIQESTGVLNIVKEINWDALRQRLARYYREGTNDYRFVLRTGFVPLLGQGGDMSAATINDLYNICEECGAKDVGKAWVNQDGAASKRGVVKDRVHSVVDMEDYILRLQQRL